MSRIRFQYLLLSAGLCASLDAATNIQVIGSQVELAGFTKVIAEGTSGTANNYTSVIVGDYAVFDIEKDGNDYADLVVTLDSINNAQPDLMLVQTVNSQGLVDTGTLSFLLDVNSAGSMTFTFEWFEPGSYTSGTENDPSNSVLLSDPIKYTSFDIDFNQEVGLDNAHLDSTTLYGSPSLLTVTDDGTTTWGRDSGANSSFDNPETAISFLTTTAPAVHTITMGKQSGTGAALFMFEFRDPPTVVPEPSATGVLLGLLSAFMVMRRRR